MNTTARWHDGMMEICSPTQQPDRGPASVGDAGPAGRQRARPPDPRRRRFRPEADERLYVRGRGHRAQGQGAGQDAMEGEDDFSHDFYRPAGSHISRAPSARTASWLPGRTLRHFFRRRPAAVSGGDLFRKPSLFHIAPNLRHATSLMPLLIPGCLARAGGTMPRSSRRKASCTKLRWRRGTRPCRIPVGIGEPTCRAAPRTGPVDPSIRSAPPARSNWRAEKAGSGK